MNSPNKIKLGAFIILSATLLIGGFLATGINRIFAPKVKAMTVLDTSVEGLSVGSQVKYLGLPVGKVTRVAMRKSDGYIAVYFDLSPSALDQAGSASSTVNAANLAETLTKNNPSCFVNASGLMGGTFLELTLGGRTPPQLPNMGPLPENVFYIQSRPSHIGNAIQNISRLLDDLSNVNFVLLSDKLDQALDSANELFSRGDLSAMLKHMNAISRDLEHSVTNLRMALSEENIQKFNKSISSIERSTTGLGEVVNPEALGALFANVNSFLDDSRKFLDKSGKAGEKLGAEALDLRQRLEESLTRLDNTTRQLERFIGNIEDNPNQFVVGRPQVKEK